MKKLFVLILWVVIACTGCKKCVICTDTMTVTRTKSVAGYPYTLQDVEEFCGRERPSTGWKKEKEIVAPGDTIIYFMERTCVGKK